MAKSFADLDFLGLFATRKRLDDPVSSDPAGLGTGDEGRTWTNTTSHKWKYWNGSAAVDPTARSAHSGTQTASTISDLAATVQAYTLDVFADPAADLDLASHRLINVTDPSSNQDAATKNYVDTQLAGLTSGQVLKGAVKVAATSNISISAAPSAVDGITLSNGDIVLLTAQSTGSQGGPYVFNGAGNAMTRALNWDSDAEAQLGSYWIVQQGTHADEFALLSNDTAITVGTTVPTFVFRGSAGATYTAGNGLTLAGTEFNVGAGTGITVGADTVGIDTSVVGRKVTGIVPTTTTGIVTVSGAVVTINHGLSNSAPSVTIAAYTSPYTGFTQGDMPIHGAIATDANNVQVTLPAAPSSNNWYYSIVG